VNALFNHTSMTVKTSFTNLHNGSVAIQSVQQKYIDNGFVESAQTLQHTLHLAVSRLWQASYVMARFRNLLISALLLAPAASTIYTGFNYGSFWGVDSNVKRADDFRDSFSYAQNLTTAVPFNSARLFTCKTQGTVDEPTGAFDAAVETKTNLLLGFWMTPQKRGDPLHGIIHNELSALEKGFKKHGQALADLVIGLSVGSEDIYRWEDTEGKEVGVSATDISAAIKEVKRGIADSSFAQYMKDKPIGHVDTAKYAVVDGADFFGMTAYPYWNKDPVTNGKESFLGSLNNVKQRAGNTPIYIAEMGWSYQGPQQGDAVASAENLQQYWTEVGCSVVGMYTTFWFELIKDSEANQPDWGILDPTTHKPRIDLKCPGLAGPSVPAAPASSSPSSSLTTRMVSSNPTPVTPPSSSKAPAQSPQPPVESTLGVSSPEAVGQSTTHVTTTIIVTVQPSGPSQTLVQSSQSNQPSIESTVFAVPSAVIIQSTTHVTNTITVTVKPSIGKHSLASLKVGSENAPIGSSAAAAPEPTAAPGPSIIPSNVPWCVTVADIAWDGQYVPVAGNPAGLDGKCTPPPTYNGLPYGSSQPTNPPTSPSEPNSGKLPISSPPSSEVVVSSMALPSSAAQAPVPSSSMLASPNPVTPIPSIPTAPVVPSSPNPVASPSSSKAARCRVKKPSSVNRAPAPSHQAPAPSSPLNASLILAPVPSVPAVTNIPNFPAPLIPGSLPGNQRPGELNT
jgi:glucan endo-1,3-beta-D-glucosidase